MSGVRGNVLFCCRDAGILLGASGDLEKHSLIVLARVVARAF